MHSSLIRMTLSIKGDCSPKSPFLGATSAKSQKMEQDYSPFGQSLVESDIALHSISTPF